MTDTNDLLDAVDQLTLPQRRRQAQDLIHTSVLKDDDGIEREHQTVIGTQKVTVELPALLEQLDEAIRSSMGGSTPGAKLASESSILNTTALYEAILIENAVTDWCHLAGVKPHRYPKNTAADLRAWYAATLSRNLTDELEQHYVTQLNDWAGKIRGLLDPPRERELPDDCPVCGAGEFWRDGERYFHPLVVHYRPTGPDMIQHARAMCRACATVWRVRELAFELEASEQSRRVVGE